MSRAYSKPGRPVLLLMCLAYGMLLLINAPCLFSTYLGIPCPGCGMRRALLAAGLFGIFLGGLGVHSFYLGYTGKGIAQILLSFCFGIGAIWGLIEGILILASVINTDAYGVPLRDW